MAQSLILDHRWATLAVRSIQWHGEQWPWQRGVYTSWGGWDVAKGYINRCATWPRVAVRGRDLNGRWPLHTKRSRIWDGFRGKGTKDRDSPCEKDMSRGSSPFSPVFEYLSILLSSVALRGHSAVPSDAILRYAAPSFVRNLADTKRWNRYDVSPIATRFRFDGC